MGKLMLNDKPYSGVYYNNIPIIYSEEEREIGVWTDGRPLYRRTISGTVTVTSTSRNWYVILSTSQLSNVENVVPVVGSYIVNTSDGQVFPIPTNTGVNVGQSVSCIYNSTAGLRFCLDGISTGNLPYSITIQYTKTTDQPGSGTYTPSGEKAHHYSTNEHIVGTWIDGSTIYERTVEITDSFSSSYHYDISGFANEIIDFEGYFVCTTNNGTWRIPLNYYEDSSLRTYTGYSATNNYMFFKVYSGFTGQKAMVTIRYTKSTS